MSLVRISPSPYFCWPCLFWIALIFIEIHNLYVYFLNKSRSVGRWVSVRFVHKPPLIAKCSTTEFFDITYNWFLFSNVINNINSLFNKLAHFFQNLPGMNNSSLSSPCLRIYSTKLPSIKSTSGRVLALLSS